MTIARIRIRKVGNRGRRSRVPGLLVDWLARPWSSPVAKTSVNKSEDLKRSGSGPNSELQAEGKSNSMGITTPSAQTSEQPRGKLSKSAEVAPESHQQTTHLASKIKVKQEKGVKGIILGVGKELKRVATTLGYTVHDHIPSSKNKKSKAAKERQLLMSDAGKPQVRDTDEIKRAYGHTTDTGHAAKLAHEKLCERGKKLTAIQDRSSQLESEAANFASLAQDLQKKMENRKWYKL
ncbi:hypothetical protein R1flu_010643 [Riccia fluitans]|uniref:V-SNARE coiled-coil homology domain-containing protein n=1 Tax=Riccia fluitans TaxID=41844 RepID=A0ABD1Z5J7_9MARC